VVVVTVEKNYSVIPKIPAAVPEVLCLEEAPWQVGSHREMPESFGLQRQAQLPSDDISFRPGPQLGEGGALSGPESLTHYSGRSGLTKKCLGARDCLGPDLPASACSNCRSFACACKGSNVDPLRGIALHAYEDARNEKVLTHERGLYLLLYFAYCGVRCYNI